MEEMGVLRCEEAVINDESVRVKLDRIYIQLRILLLANVCDTSLLKILLQTLLVVAGEVPGLILYNLIQDIAGSRAVTQRGISSADPVVEERVERTVRVHPAAIVLEDDIILLETLVEVGRRLIDTRNVAINEVDKLVLVQRILQHAHLGVRNLIVERAAIALKILGDAGLHPLKRKERVLAKIAYERAVDFLVETVEMKTVVLHILHEVYEEINSERDVSAVTVCDKDGVVGTAHEYTGLYNSYRLRPFSCIDIYYKNNYMLSRCLFHCSYLYENN